MGFFDQISKTISQGVDRAKFEAEKFQKTTKLQGEVNEFRRQIDAKLMELGQRAYDLQRAGQINVPSIAELSSAVDQLRSAIVVKEEELKLAQIDTFAEVPTSTPSTPPTQQVPISYDSVPAQGPVAPPQPQAATVKSCGSCGFQMPNTAMFCPNCGSRTL